MRQRALSYMSLATHVVEGISMVESNNSNSVICGHSGRVRTPPVENDEVTGPRVNHVFEHGPSFSTLFPLLGAHRRRPHIMRFSSTLNPLSQSNGDVPIAIVSYEGKRKFVLKMESFEVRRARL